MNAHRQKIKSGNNKVLTVLLLGASSKLNACDIAILLITLIEVAADRGETQGYDVMLIASESPIIRVRSPFATNIIRV